MIANPTRFLQGEGEDPSPFSEFDADLDAGRNPTPYGMDDDGPPAHPIPVSYN